MRPRPYLSFSQMTTFEMSKEKFANEYLYGQKRRISRNMAYGSIMADGLEAEEFSGDPLLDLIMARLPKLDRMDKIVECENGVKVWYDKEKRNVLLPALTDGKELIPILAKPDTSRNDLTAFKEYKTSVRKWTQKMVDESGQITFYATAIWLITGKVPNDIELVNAKTAYDEDGRLYMTGDLYRYPTKRTMIDIIKMTNRIKRAWSGIKELCEKELL